jgi:hypothetical protein
MRRDVIASVYQFKYKAPDRLVRGFCLRRCFEWIFKKAAELFKFFARFLEKLTARRPYRVVEGRARVRTLAIEVCDHR